MRVLIIEDNKRTASLIKEGLLDNHFAVDICHDFDSGLSASLDPDYDIVLIDRRLPGNNDGLDICNTMRKSDVHTPVIMLTAQGDIRDKVEGLSNGADDYIVKPFSIKELVARIGAINRRPKTFNGVQVKVGDLVVDVTKHTVSRNNIEIKLTPKEYAILVLLIHNKDRPLSKSYIVSHTWDADADVLPNSVETYISGLRRKIDAAFKSQPKLIKTVWGVGYKISET
jgi:two-component system OmpR family response regulator